jgi:putative hydrolase
MIDLHTHTFLSDGVLVAAELVRRAADAGYRCLGITDHADGTNLETVIAAARIASDELEKAAGITIVPGVELTHIPPALIPDMVRRSRDLGAELVVVHGETIVEPVAPGTNRMAIRGGADILSHPGLISLADAKLAARRGVLLEVTARKGHSLANGHVVQAAGRAGAGLIFGTDSHAPGDLVGRDAAERIARGAGMNRRDIGKMFSNAEKLVRRLHGRLQRHG